MSKTFIYDESFSSLLALIMTLIIKCKKPDDIKSKDEYKDNLLDMPVYLKIDYEKINKIIKSRLSNNIIKSCYYLFLSNEEEKEIIMFYFIKNSLKYKNEVYYHRNLNCVNKTNTITKYVNNELHKLKGFLRFKEMKNNFLYAEIAPTNNILNLLAMHFKKRLSNEYWIIKDVNRNLYALYDRNKILYLKGENIINLNINFNSNEKLVEDLWKSFFYSVSIKERKNLKCQQNFMPKKYWKYMIEMEDKL